MVCETRHLRAALKAQLNKDGPQRMPLGLAQKMREDGSSVHLQTMRNQAAHAADPPQAAPVNGDRNRDDLRATLRNSVSSGMVGTVKFEARSRSLSRTSLTWSVGDAFALGDCRDCVGAAGSHLFEPGKAARQRFDECRICLGAAIGCACNHDCAAVLLTQVDRYGEAVGDRQGDFRIVGHQRFELYLDDKLGIGDNDLLDQLECGFSPALDCIDLCAEVARNL